MSCWSTMPCGGPGDRHGSAAPEAGERNCRAGKSFPLRRVGCAGRITAFTEADDGLVMFADRHRALSRHRVELDQPSRFCRVDFRRFRTDFRPAQARRRSTGRRVRTLKLFVTANDLRIDWKGIGRRPTRRW